MFCDATFIDPEKSSKPLQFALCYDYKQGAGKREKLKAALAALQRVKSSGFGGVVTCYCFENSFEGYLVEPEGWEIFRDVIRYAHDNGLRVWLYDEKGYPSGSAGSLVLKQHPEYEALGLAGIFVKAEGGKKAEIKHPYGHGRVIMAKAFPGDLESDFDIGAGIDLSPCLDSFGNLSWMVPDGRYTICYFVTKPLFEGTHATSKYAGAVRYANLLNKDAVRRFIDVTYNAYYENVGEYFGNTIEAFFTDEPSLIAEYFPKVPSESYIDKPDSSVPLFPSVAWDGRLPGEFYDRFGYDLLPCLPFLFAGKSKKARQVRLDYRKLLSRMLSDSYFRQISEFCHKHNVKFSGHILWEENLKMHAALEGDYFNSLKYMDDPGIDILTFQPGNILKDAVIPKLVSSVADLYNRPHVMCEFSDFTERVFDKTVGGEEYNDLNLMKCSCALQQALGVDLYNSMFDLSCMPQDHFQEFNTYSARISTAMDGGTSAAQTALFYPIETIGSYYLPSSERYDLRRFPPVLTECERSWKNATKELLENQIVFSMVNSHAVTSGRISDGGLVLQNGCEISSIIFPRNSTVEPDLLYQLGKAADSGVMLFMAGDLHTTEYSPDSLLKSGSVFMAESENELVHQLKNRVKQDVLLDKKRPEIVCQRRKFRHHDLFLFVNTSGNDLAFRAEMRAKGLLKEYDPETGGISEDSEYSGGYYPIKLKAWHSILLTINHLPED